MIYYDEYGDKLNPGILLLHGAAATDTFCNQYCFQDRFHLIVPHLFGSGNETGKIYMPEAQIKAIRELIESMGREKITVIGHSLGAELAVALVSRYPDFFEKAVFLSAWVCATEKSIGMYSKIAALSWRSLKMGELIRWQAKYWHYSKEQADFMVSYSKKISKEQYVAWFRNRIKLDELPEYSSVGIPMLSVCGARETAEMRASQMELGKRNKNCKTIMLNGASHDYPMRMPEELNPILRKFIMS